MVDRRQQDLELLSKAYSYIAFPTIRLGSKIKSDGQAKFKIHVDRKAEYERVLGKPLSLKGEILDAGKAMAVLLNAFIRAKLGYPINIESVEITSFDRCPLTAVADAFANFTFGLVEATLSRGTPSESQRAKAKVLRGFFAATESENLSSIEDRIKECFEIRQGKINSRSDKTLVSVFTVGA